MRKARFVGGPFGRIFTLYVQYSWLRGVFRHCGLLAIFCCGKELEGFVTFVMLDRRGGKAQLKKRVASQRLLRRLSARQRLLRRLSAQRLASLGFFLPEVVRMTGMGWSLIDANRAAVRMTANTYTENAIDEKGPGWFWGLSFISLISLQVVAGHIAEFRHFRNRGFPAVYQCGLLSQTP